jgi:hypothetical protein
MHGVMQKPLSTAILGIILDGFWRSLIITDDQISGGIEHEHDDGFNHLVNEWGN